MTRPDFSDGCTHWLNGSWEHCCWDHDRAYELGEVTLMTHWALAKCVSGTGGGLLMGLVMFAGCTVWWLLKRKCRGAERAGKSDG